MTTAALIPLTTAEDGATAVLGRDLHAFLEVKARYNDWFPRMVKYGFAADQDYTTHIVKVAGQPGYSNLSTTRIDHIMTMDMAKEVAMIQHTDKGKQARQYFIAIEKEHRANQAPALPTTYVEALEALVASEKAKAELKEANAQQFAELEIAQPKVEAFDTFMDATGTYSIGTAAKMLGIGRTTLFRRLRDAGVLIGQGNMRNTPYQRYSHHFNVTPRTHELDSGKVVTTYATRIYPSGVDFIARKLNTTANAALMLDA